MRRLLAVAVLAMTLGLGGVAVTTDAGAHEGAVALCNPEGFERFGHGGFNWRWWLCNHGLHTGPPGDPGEYHTQWRNGLGTPEHTVRNMRIEVREFRDYVGIP